MFAGKQRDHTPTPEFPFVVVLVDEIAFLTAYQADRKLRERILAALTTQGRAVGYCVMAAGPGRRGYRPGVHWPAVGRGHSCPCHGIFVPEPASCLR